MKNWDISTAEGLANAMEWQVGHINRIAQGGVWVVPRSFSVYRIDHDARVATKLAGLPEPDIRKVFAAIGWTVEPTYAPGESKATVNTHWAMLEPDPRCGAVIGFPCHDFGADT